jgi:HAD superfamily phosphatase
MIVFDMDGVLVEVTESYRETICRTVEHFTGRKITRELVQEYKNAGGWNNDWLLSQKIAADLGTEVPYATVVTYFNAIFFGNLVDGIPDGLMARERWIPEAGLLEGLRSRYRLSVFTGRLREEAMMTLRRFARDIPFSPVVGADDVTRAKPDPEGLNRIRESHPQTELWYVGDTVDDSRSAQAAGIPFVGVAAPGVPYRERLLELFSETGAMAVIEDVNQLPDVVNRR